MSGDTVYLNGDLLPADEARVSVLDRGFIFGDGVYEVVPVYGGHPFRLPQHLARLQRSLDGIRLANPHDDATWTAIVDDLVRANGDGDLSVYLQVTRGAARRDHGFPPDTPPTVFGMATPLRPPAPELVERGASAITLPDPRWEHCHIKATSLLPNVLLRQEAIDAGADEAILLRDGVATEGAASNLFIVADGVIRTPAKGNLLLPGITRDLVVELARDNGLPCEETTVTAADLAAADEVWLTSSTKEVLAVTRLDDVTVGDGRPGPVWSRMHALYQDYKRGLQAGRNP